MSESRFPSAEQIGRALWEKHHEKVPPDSIHGSRQWRANDIPQDFWDAYVDDGVAVLDLFRKQQRGHS